jgi:hypothetical protein
MSAAGMTAPWVAGGLLVSGAEGVAAAKGVVPMSAVGVSLMICGNRDRRSARLRVNVSAAAGAVGDGGGVAAAGCWRGEIMSKRKSMGLERDLGDEVDEDRA